MKTPSMKKLVLIVAWVVFQAFPEASLMAGDVYADFPVQIDTHRSYVVYSHGQIVEGDDPRPVHKLWGQYDFPAIISALAENQSFALIAPHRPANTDLEEYVDRLTEWVCRLTDAGVKPENITLVGFSRGGHMTALAADKLKPLNINTALLGTCWQTGVQDQSSITLSGRLFSVYETSDSARSCSKLASRSPQLSSFEEISISTGLEHGAFYIPLSDWVEPLLLWINKDCCH